MLIEKNIFKYGAWLAGNTTAALSKVRTNMDFKIAVTH